MNKGQYLGALAAKRPLLPFSDDFSGGLSGWDFSAGVWTTAAGKAVAAPTLEATELLVDGGLENWTSPTDLTSWTESVLGAASLNQESSVVYGGTYAAREDIDGTNTATFRQAIANSNGDFLQISAQMRANVANKLTYFDYIANGLTWNGTRRALTEEYAEYTETIFAGQNNSVLRFGSTPSIGGSIYFDSLSAKKIVKKDTFLSRDFGEANVDVSVKIAQLPGRLAGIVFNLDSVASPLNYVIAHLLTTGADRRVRLDQVVNGVVTNKINSTIAYGDNKILRLQKSGETYSLFYDNTQVGVNQTISTAGIIGNTRHGLFSTGSANTFDDFSIVKN